MRDKREVRVRERKEEREGWTTGKGKKREEGGSSVVGRREK